MSQYSSVVDALSHNDLFAARDLLLTQLLKDTEGRNSWDAPWYTADKDIQKGIKIDMERNKLFSYFGLENLADRYLMRDAEGKLVENPQTFYARVATGIARGDAAFAQELYDIMSKHWFLPATPVLMNIGTSKGLPISCFLNTVPDTLEGIFDLYRENAFLAKNGGGIGMDWSRLRGNGSPLKKSGLKSSGVIPFLKVMDSETLAISRNSIRRGAAAAYLRIDHPDIEEFLEIRKPTGGDIDRKCLNIHHAVVITDTFMQAVEKGEKYSLIDPHYKTVVKELDAVEMWRKLLTVRAETGEPYFMFLDTVNRAIPDHHREKGLFVNQSNLCSEIVLPTNDERTAVCCLSSLNLERYDEWKDQFEHIAYLAVKALDNNLDTFIEMADPVEFKKAIFSARAERAIGLGVMGYHGYLMGKNLPFESVGARLFNKEYFATMQKHANAASVKLAEERGLPPDGGVRRNSYLLSLQPTASTAFLCGEASPCVEPITGNAYLQKTLSGSFLVKNKYLDRLFAAKGIIADEIWKSVIAARGSVQHLDMLTEEEKAVFRTAEEMNMREIVTQAADRQPFICQAQSINLFFRAPISGKYLHESHFLAWKLGVKTLYYLRSSAPIEADKIDVKGFKRDLANEECAVCQ